MSLNIAKSDVESLIRMALDEDIKGGDITSEAIFSGHESSSASIISKGRGIACGVEIVVFVFEVLDPGVKVTCHVKDGMKIGPGEEVLQLEGPIISLLSGERTALNFIQRMSGISTKTAEICALLEGTGITLLDTRKTMPGMRKLDKYAVKTGGGGNHRMGLYDMVMIKDNHIKAAGSIEKAVMLTRKKYGTRYTLEVEASTIDEVEEAAACGVDIIMLDNMTDSMMRDSVEVIRKRAKIEVSGSINKDRIEKIRNLPVDYISMGALTHSVKAFDLSMSFGV